MYGGDDLELSIHEYATERDIPFWSSDERIIWPDDARFDEPLIISIGGDGTFLNTARLALECYPNHAIFPINTGHLGFLTNGRKFNGFEHLEGTLDAVFDADSDKIKFENRMALKAKVSDERYLALNEFFVACGQNEMMTYRIFVNDKQIAEQSGSGVLVSTATGSTAHALSAGGPIISPNTNVMAIVPVVPHSLTSRPIILSGRDTVTISADWTIRNRIHLHGDGNQLYEMGGAVVEIEKYLTPVTIVRPHDWDFFDVLSQKMGWKINV